MRIQSGRGFWIAAALFAVACGGSTTKDADITGTWLGTVTVSGAPVRIVFNLADNSSGTVDVPEQGVFGDTLTQVDVTGRHVVLQIGDVGARYQGDVQSDDTTIKGSFIQGLNVIALDLAKQPGPLDYRRPQDPVPPYPYQTEDVTFAGGASGVTLAGTITWPAGAGPFKAVVLISGSGPNNRNEELLNHRPFLVLSDALTRAGVATLRYDKRGVAASTGDYDTATSADFAADARAAAQYLRSQTRFTVSSIGFIGHSEGGLLAPMAADGNPDISFLVMLAGPGVPGAQVIIAQDYAIGAANGQTTADLDANKAVETQLYACFATTSDPAELDRQLRAVLTSAGVSAAQQDMIVAQLNTPWMRFFALYDPAPVLARTTIPVLALNGSLDLQVLPDQNLPPIRAALAGNSQATIQELTGLNHLFQHATTGSPAEYGTIDETMSPDVLAQVSAWIVAR
jgi:alpha/beta superfamily hydrolase